MVLLPLGTLRALQNEVLELRSQILTLKGSTQKQLQLFDDVLSLRLASTETKKNTSDSNGDDNDDGFDQAWREDKVARKVAVKRVRRLAQDHHSGEQRAHLEFMADIVSVTHKSKVDSQAV